MSKLDSLHFAGTDFMVEEADLAPELVVDLRACNCSGDAEPAVDHVLANYTITGEVEDCRAFLRPYGAWDEAELADHAWNLKRLVWLAGCDLAESGEIYFAGY